MAKKKSEKIEISDKKSGETRFRRPANLMGVFQFSQVFELSQQSVKNAITKHGLQQYTHEDYDPKVKYFRVSEVCAALYKPEDVDGDVEPKKAYDREKFYAAKLKKLDYQLKKGEVVDLGEVRTYFSEFVASLRQVAENFPDQCEKDYGMSGKDVERMQTAMDKLLVIMRQSIMSFTKDWRKRRESDREPEVEVESKKVA